MPGLLVLFSAMLLVGRGLHGAAPSTRDLNHNRRIDPYEDPRRPVSERVADLLAQMTLEEKIGTLLHGSAAPAGGAAGAGYDLAAMEERIARRHVTSFVTRLDLPPREFARQNNALQQIAARTRLGIPVTISSDPRHHFQGVEGASHAGGRFSQWPEALGLGAIGNEQTVRRFADIVRREYRAMGITMALFPQADLATEPRWPRLAGTFGADPEQVSRLNGAYVEGLQGGPDGLRRDGVAAIAKHWVGYGAAPHGFDAHNYYGREARLDDASLALHERAFQDALRRRVAGVMPAYPILRGVTQDGVPLEPVAPGFNRQLLQDRLRVKYRYEGLLLSDWAIVNDCPERCRAPTAEAPQTPPFIATPWGMENATRAERAARALNAGIDQIGGLDDPAPLKEAIERGLVSMQRVDEAVARVLTLKFQLGLFDDPFVEEPRAAQVVGQAAWRRLGERAQREAQVLLENREGLLPLRQPRLRVWLDGIAPAAARSAGLVAVANPADADVALLRMQAPSERLHPHHFFGAIQNEGRLDFRPGDAGHDALMSLPPDLPAVVAVDMDRPAILTSLRGRATALLALFGASDAALLDVVTGRATPRGRLPLNLPSSMQAVEAQDPALPDDDAQPLFPRGHRADISAWR
nr:MAG: beta-glucosidase [Pseudomonadota bacterium]